MTAPHAGDELARIERKRSIRKLRAFFRFSPLLVVEDPAPDQRGCWSTAQAARQALLSEAAENDLLLVLQDDVQVCRSFYRIFVPALSYVPRDVALVSLYSGRQATLKGAQKHEQAWTRTDSGVLGLATVQRPSAMRDFLSWVHDHQYEIPPGVMTADDSLLNLWLAATGRQAWVTVPSLVQHVSTRSTLGHAAHLPGRRANLFADDIPDPEWHGLSTAEYWSRNLSRPLFNDQGRILGKDGLRYLEGLKGA